MARRTARPRLRRDARGPAISGRHTPRKRFGQHFLADAGVVAQIVAAIDPKPGEALVEIGPGLGAMTHPLLDRCRRLTVIELDRDLATKMRRHAALEVVEADVLTVDFAALAGAAGQSLRVVGNLPYNISTPILFHLLGAVDHVVDQHFMLQKEVVERMVAVPGNKDYGRLSVMLQWRYHIESVLDVPPAAFDPPPRVDSAVVRMLPLPCESVADIDVKRLSELVAVAFSQRRKILRHTLGAWLTAQQIDIPFDLQRRAEEIPVAEYLALARHSTRSIAAPRSLN